MPESWVKLQTDILNSSIMRENIVVKWVWTTCLILAREQDWEGGTFKTTPYTLASRAGLIDDPILEQLDVAELVNDALDVLGGPDPASSTEDEEGRRLLYLGGNRYQIVNWDLYQDSPQRAKWRRQKAEQRAKRTGGGQGADTGWTGGGQGVDLPSVSVSVSKSNPTSVSKKKKKVSERVDYSDGFLAMWEKSWKRGNKKAAFETWNAMSPEDQVECEGVIGSWSKAFEQREAQKRPHVSTWLNGRSWEDDVSAEYGKGRGAMSDEATVSKYAKFD